MYSICKNILLVEKLTILDLELISVGLNIEGHSPESGWLQQLQALYGNLFPKVTLS